MKTKITPDRLRRIGYTRSRYGHWNKRGKVRGRDSIALVQLRPLCPQMDDPIIFECNSQEFGPFSGIEFSRVESMQDLRSWERFAFCL